jgi:hypothetical protein
MAPVDDRNAAAFPKGGLGNDALKGSSISYMRRAKAKRMSQQGRVDSLEELDRVMPHTIPPGPLSPKWRHDAHNALFLRDNKEEEST